MRNLDPASAVLVTKPEHVFYLTGFSGEGFAIATAKKTLLATDMRYWILAKEVKKKEVKLFKLAWPWEERIREELKAVKTMIFEEDHLTVEGLSRWKKRLPGKQWKENKGMLKKLRLVKSPEELRRLREAAQIGDLVLKKALKALRPGVTEKSVANLLRQYAHEFGDGVSFDPIVAFGKNAAIPHHHSGQTKLKKDDMILIDEGAKYRGYMSDMTRCFQAGNGIPEVVRMYELLFQVQKKTVAMVKPGISVRELDKAARTMLGKEDKYFTHSLGHGVGVEIHEDPPVSSRCNTVLQAGMVITIEPGIYKENLGGVRIEDTLIVTKTGCEVITKNTKKLELT